MHRRWIIRLEQPTPPIHDPDDHEHVPPLERPPPPPAPVLPTK